jgi:molybdate transport system substrate-binding protein
MLKGVDPEVSKDGNTLRIYMANYYDFVNKGVRGVKNYKNAPNSPYKYKNYKMSEEGRKSIKQYIQSGKAKPDISNAEALKKTLLEASSIAYTGTGASGIYFAKLVDQLGIGEQVRAKSKTPPGGIIAEIIAKGDAEIGVQMISELTGVKGTEYIGPLPGQLQLYTVFSIGQMKNSKEVEAGKALTKFLTSPEAINVYKKQGMEAI